MLNILKSFYSDLLDYTQKVKHSLIEYAAPVYIYLARTDRLFLNFDPALLCPKNLTDDQTREWAESYAKKLKRDALLLWSDSDQHLNVLFIKKEKLFHQCFLDSTVNLTTKEISSTRHKFQTLQDLNAALKWSLPAQVQLPNHDTLQRLKRKVYLKNKEIDANITSEILQENEQTRENLATCCQCSICLEAYSKNAQPVLIPSGFVYHRECIEQHFNTQLSAFRKLSDPQTRQTIPFIQGSQDFDRLFTQDAAYLALIHNLTELEKNNKALAQALDILLNKNQQLEIQKEQLEAKNQQLEEEKHQIQEENELLGNEKQQLLSLFPSSTSLEGSQEDLMSPTHILDPEKIPEAINEQSSKDHVNHEEDLEQLILKPANQPFLTAAISSTVNTASTSSSSSGVSDRAKDYPSSRAKRGRMSTQA